MLQSRKLLATAVVAALLPACSDRSTVGPQFMEQASMVADQSVPDLSGAWNWSSVEVLRMPQWFVEAMGPILGIIPESHNTHARCESAGTMTLLQTGAEFQGTATRTFNICETRGGQLFQQLEGGLAVADGRISGGSLRFSFHTAIVRPCPHHAVISHAQVGVAIGLSGTGRCILPGHPQSESPLVLDPPQGGTSKTLSWEAWRP